MYTCAHRARFPSQSPQCGKPVLLPGLSDPKDLYSSAALLLTLTVPCFSFFDSSVFLSHLSTSSGSLNLEQQLPGLAFFPPKLHLLWLVGSLVGFQLTLFSCCPHSAVAQFWVRPGISRSQCYQNWWYLLPLLSWAPVLLDSLSFVLGFSFILHNGSQSLSSQYLHCSVITQGYLDSQVPQSCSPLYYQYCLLR